MLLAWWLALILGTPPTDTGFLIETVHFTGLEKASEEILRNSLLMEEGKVYTEADIARGRYRLERLPFVLRAEPRLGRGSQRGAYSLTYDIVENKRWFWAYLSDFAYLKNDYRDIGILGGLNALTENYEVRINALTFGYRWYLGSNGELTAFAPHRPGLQYTHYNIFGRSVVGSLALQTPIGYGKNYSDFPEFNALTDVDVDSSYGLTFNLGAPYKRNHWFNFTYQGVFGDVRSTSPLGVLPTLHKDTNFRLHRSEFAWWYDTKDHPLYPTSGVLLKSTGALDREIRNVNDQGEPGGFLYQNRVPYQELKVDGFTWDLIAQKYWARPFDTTFGLEAGVRVGQHNIDVTNPDPDYLPAQDYDSSRWHIRGLTAWNLWEFYFWGNERDFRFEFEAGVWFNRSSLEGVFPDPDYTRSTLKLSLTSRDNRGLFRLTLVYSTEQEELWQ